MLLRSYALAAVLPGNVPQRALDFADWELHLVMPSALIRKTMAKAAMWPGPSLLHFSISG